MGPLKEGLDSFIGTLGFPRKMGKKKPKAMETEIANRNVIFQRKEVLNLRLGSPIEDLISAFLRAVDKLLREMEINTPC